MFRNVPECSGMFHVPGFIDGRLIISRWWVNSGNKNVQSLADLKIRRNKFDLCRKVETELLRASRATG